MLRSPETGVDFCWRENASLNAHPLGCAVAFAVFAAPLLFLC